MGLERRGGNLYYYEKTRIGSRVVSRYLGSGVVAQAYAMHEEAEREEKVRKVASERRQIEGIEEEERAFDAIAQMVESITEAALIVHGFHQHKRQWRLIRGGQK